MNNMHDHLREIERHENKPQEMVLMRFFQSNLKDPKLERPTGELVIIDSISDKPRPLVHASELAKERIKHEIAESKDNIFKKGFYVDVFVDTAAGKIAAYKLINFHQVIDLPDDAAGAI